MATHLDTDGKDRTLSDPLPYTTGYTAPQPAVVADAGQYGYGYGVAPEPVWSPPAPGEVEVPARRRAGSPVLAVAGLLSLGVAGWAILGAPVITPTVMLAAGLVLMVAVGLVMVIRL